MSIDQLMKEALSLPNDLRLQLVEKLLDSLEVELDESIQSEWLLEAKKRRDDIRNGYYRRFLVKKLWRKSDRAK